jgi:hypothetical protein
MANTKAADRYRLTPQRVDDFVAPGRMRYEMWKPPAFTARAELDLPDGQFDLYTVSEKDVARLDALAWRFYQDVTLWWVIAWVNNIDNPLTDMTAGMVLQIPKRTFVDRVIEASK